MSTPISVSLMTKLDEFATGLEPDEQAMLAALLSRGNDDEVSGFGAAWPGASALMRDAVTLGPSGNGWLKDPGTDSITMGPGGSGWLKDPGMDSITVGPSGTGW